MLCSLSPLIGHSLLARACDWSGDSPGNVNIVTFLSPAVAPLGIFLAETSFPEPGSALSGADDTMCASPHGADICCEASCSCQRASRVSPDPDPVLVAASAHSEYYHASLTPTLLSTSTYKSNTTRLRTDWREQELYNFHDNNIHPRLHCLSLFLLKTSCVRVVDNAADAAVPLTPPWCHLGSLQHGDWRLQSNECAACRDCSSAACRVSLSCQGRFNSPRLVTTSGVMT